MSKLPKIEKGPLEMNLGEGLMITLFPKMEPGQPKVDVIRLDVTQYEGQMQSICMTPAEALQISIGLQSAVQMYLLNQKEYRSDILVPQNKIANKRAKAAVAKKAKIKDMDATMDAAEYVRIRKSLGFTQARLAEILGVSIKTVQSHEQGRASVSSLIARIMRMMVENENLKLEMLLSIRSSDKT